jgi:regulator of sigma E protease
MFLYALSFIFVISVVVFVHEFGHYIAAIANGVKVEEFSIGFGKQIFAKTDKRGTVWKVCMLPLGGYVKMYGDENVASANIPLYNAVPQNNTQKQSILYKKNWQKIIISAAGPIANYLLSFAIYATIFTIIGIKKTDTTINQFASVSLAAEAGMQIGDKITSINGETTPDGVDVQRAMALFTGNAVTIDYIRKEKPQQITITKKEHGRMYLGIAFAPATRQELSIGMAMVKSCQELITISKTSLISFGQILTLKRSVKDLSGPIKIAKFSGDASKQGILHLVGFIAFISVSLGVLNLMPIPMLDGGHILLYTLEYIKRGVFHNNFYVWFYRSGTFFVGFLVVITVLNDIISLFIK